VATKQVNIDIIAKDKTRQAMNSATKNVERLKGSFFNLKNAIIGIGTAVLVKSIVQVTSEFEDLKDSLDAVTGSTEEGTKAFNFISEFALTSQFNIQQLTRSFITLKASGIEPTEKLFRTFTDTASVTTDQLATLEALTRVFSRGVQGGLGLEELNQIADRGIAVFKMLEDEIGVSRNELSEFGKTADGAKVILQALEKTLSETFAGATERKMDNISTALSNMNIALQKTQFTVGQETSPAIVKFANAVEDLLEFLDPLFVMLGKIVNFIASAVIHKFEQLGNAIAFVTGKVKDFLIFTGVMEESTKKLSDAQQDLGEVVIEVKKGLEDIGKLDTVTKAIDKNKSAIESIKESLMTELELIEHRNKKELELLAEQKKLLKEQIDLKILDGMDANAKELEMTRQHIEELTALELEVKKKGVDEKLELARKTAEEEKKIRDELFEDNLRAIKEGNFHELELEKLSISQQKDLTMKTGRELVSQLAKSNKTMFKVDKALKIAQAIMNTATGVTKALSVGNIPLAVLIGGLGAVQVATIASQKYQGFAKGGRPPVGRASIVGEEGAELFVPDQAGTIVPNDKLGMSKPVTVNFNINTVDATGFEELLVNSRGVLINLINSAVNEKGQRAII
tara:strand:- start:1852 stop:3732 length:1881 start_codon:yes stop_codon:yes gene_type:complete